MKLYTHNMLISTVKGVTNNFPLVIEPETVESREVEFDPAFIKHILPTIQYPALLAAAQQLGYKELPAELQLDEENEDVLQKLHNALFNIELIKGNLVCPESKRKFPVINGIPNMLLREDEL